MPPKLIRHQKEWYRQQVDKRKQHRAIVRTRFARELKKEGLDASEFTFRKPVRKTRDDEAASESVEARESADDGSAAAGGDGAHQRGGRSPAPSSSKGEKRRRPSDAGAVEPSHKRPVAGSSGERRGVEAGKSTAPGTSAEEAEARQRKEKKRREKDRHKWRAKMSERTQFGQPVMATRINRLLDKIKASK